MTSNINFNTDRAIILHYYSGASGKFVSSSLATSMLAEFQHKDLLNKFGSSEEKFTYFNKVITESATSELYDFNFGDIELFNYKHLDSNGSSPEQIKKHFETSNTVEQLSTGQNYFFMVSHEMATLNNMLSVWLNATVIRFVNAQPWIDYRKFSVPGKQTSEEFDQDTMPELKKGKLLIFDVVSLFDKSLYLTQIKNISDQLNLLDLNMSYIEALYDNYLTVIKQKAKT
jgi:hypothetical protein